MARLEDKLWSEVVDGSTFRELKGYLSVMLCSAYARETKQARTDPEFFSPIEQRSQDVQDIAVLLLEQMEMIRKDDLGEYITTARGRRFLEYSYGGRECYGLKIAVPKSHLSEF